jgi:hypothetical protein
MTVVWRASAELWPCSNVRASLVSPASCSGRTSARAGKTDTPAVECSPSRQRTLGVCSRSLLMRSHHRSQRCVSSQAPREHDAHALSMTGKARHPRRASGAALSSMRNHQRSLIRMTVMHITCSLPLDRSPCRLGIRYRVYRRTHIVPQHFPL